MYWDDVEKHHGGEGMDEIWLSHPLVRAEANRRIADDQKVWPVDWLERQLSGKSIDRAVVIGCGTGAFERDVVRRGLMSQVLGIDIAAAPLERARQLAREESLGDRIEYLQADAGQFLSEQRGVFDAVVFHASLHHFDRPAEILGVAHDALKQEGILYLDEYVGPSRDEWSARRLAAANIAYRLLPARLRRPRLVRAPINLEDPTEAVASSAIVPAVSRLFRVLERRDYGGNLLSVIYPNLWRVGQRPEIDRATFDRGIARLLRWENLLLRFGSRSYYSLIVASRKDS